MPLRVRGQFSFCQFKHSMAFVQETQGALNFSKDSNTVIHDHHFGCRGGFGDSNKDGGATGMVDSVIEHFRETVLPNIFYVVWHVTENRGKVVAPANAPP